MCIRDRYTNPFPPCPILLLLLNSKVPKVLCIPLCSSIYFIKSDVYKRQSYTRAGEVISVDGVKYVIESTSHSYKDGWHFDKLELSKLE